MKCLTLDEEWDEEPVIKASLAIAQPQHRSHIHSHIQEIIDSIDHMYAKCLTLIESSSSPSSPSQSQNHSVNHKLESLGIPPQNENTYILKRKVLLPKETEQLAEEIDEATHELQYKLDHCRRYVGILGIINTYFYKY